MMTFLPVVSLLASMVAADATGTWTVHLDPDFSGHQAEVTCTFKQDGRKLTGTCGEDAPLAGEVNDGRARWTIKTGINRDITATFTAELDDRRATMTGTWELSDRPDHHGKFTAQKQ